jgi:hypothetical protein
MKPTEAFASLPTRLREALLSEYNSLTGNFRTSLVTDRALGRKVLRNRFYNPSGVRVEQLPIITPKAERFCIGMSKIRNE